ncbi:hypothetical protein BDV32DRAFT_80974 [Aspergillus pseudonomiae]|uniref:Uncharacterized protein n=1 Tax=Aspergillus pseudonomiae TaxID=1506151 RepID=A0A5N7DQW5_9EURO|nr:uncharacterized protein BDV37DRAFT_157972 [Aspergillus pseudonomiae]KAB8257507.1 hypothetical protein BDV32DRAFT_80974 [Aspergillus pseudonomiae]KAE8408776.1 hypothetical protein BDV37DRAFT_157972 [Aspergillus pseudonomiae]
MYGLACMAGIEKGMRSTSLTVPLLLIYLFAWVLAHREYGIKWMHCLGLPCVVLPLFLHNTYLSN